MKLGAKQAALLSNRERDMLTSKGPWQVKELVSLIKRSRELRDKYRHQAQRQSIAATRRNLQKPDAANARTLEKAELFDRALKQYEAELLSISTACTAALRELKVGGKVPVRKKTAAKKAASKKVATPRVTSRKAVVKKPAAKKAAKKKVATHK